MTKCYLNPIRFSSVQRREVEAEFSFSGGATTGNGAISLPDVGTLVSVWQKTPDFQSVAGIARAFARFRMLDFG